MSREIVLEAAWAGHEAGAVLLVVAQGDRSPEGLPAVDAGRADWLIEQGIAKGAVEPEQQQPEAKRRRSKKGEGDGRS